MHVAIIMDGNGRWATRRGWPRVAGHRAGAKTLERIVEAAPGLGVDTLTVYAFSSDNWRRPAAEVEALMRLLRSYLEDGTARHRREGVRLTFLGRRDRLAPSLLEAMARAERETLAGERLHLRVALDYSARDAIARALSAAPGEGGREALDVDLLIRTGGEKRLSDFLLWECAYAELTFLDMMWPDFTPRDLAEALADFRRRERRYGGLAAIA